MIPPIEPIKNGVNSEQQAKMKASLAIPHFFFDIVASDGFWFIKRNLLFRSYSFNNPSKSSGFVNMLMAPLGVRGHSALGLSQ